MLLSNTKRLSHICQDTRWWSNRSRGLSKVKYQHSEMELLRLELSPRFRSGQEGLQEGEMSLWVSPFPSFRAHCFAPRRPRWSVPSTSRIPGVRLGFSTSCSI